MPLKQIETKRRRPMAVTAEAYRIPLQVRKVLKFTQGYSYPICPRCDRSIDREYMRFCDRCGQHLAWDHFEKARVVYAPRFPLKCRKTEESDTMQGVCK